MLQLNVLTLFPEYFSAVFETSILKRAQEKGALKVTLINIRDFAQDKHHVTDDRPFGGGPGMVMKLEPIYEALKAHGLQPNTAKAKIVLTSAQGKHFTQALAQTYAGLETLTIICGHYEGVDERVTEHLVDEEVRIGDYVLTGGEPAAAVVADAVIRLLPEVLGNELSTADESHTKPGQLGYPQYTRPETFNNWRVPHVLLGGDHQAIAQWRQEHRKTEK